MKLVLCWSSVCSLPCSVGACVDSPQVALLLVVPSFFLWESQLTLPRPQLQSAFNLHPIATRGFPGSSLRQQLCLESQLHLLGWEVKLLSLRSLPAHVVQRSVGSVGRGPVQAESKPLSRTSWEFWCLHPSTTHCVAAYQMQPRGWVLLQCHHDCMGEAGCPGLSDHQQDQDDICIVLDTRLSSRSTEGFRPKRKQ